VDRTVLLKVCPNGTRPPGAHPALPLTPAELGGDTAAAVAAGAAAVHLHPADPRRSIPVPAGTPWPASGRPVPASRSA
jgi:uncharacterized protein (DUF849 family)